MKKLSSDEYTGLKESRGDEAIKFVLMLGIQETAIIEPQDWVLRTSPSTYFKNRFMTKGMNYEVRKLNDNKGWIIKRTS